MDHAGYMPAALLNAAAGIDKNRSLFRSHSYQQFLGLHGVFFFRKCLRLLSLP